MARRAVIYGADVSFEGNQEPLRLTIARFGDKYYDVGSGNYVISAYFLRFIESTYELPLAPAYNFVSGMKDAQAAYRTGKKPFNVSTLTNVNDYAMEVFDPNAPKSLFVACRRIWSKEHYAMPVPDTIKFAETIPLPWVAQSDGVFLRSIRYPDLIVSTSLKPGVYNVIFHDDEKGIEAYAISDPRNATGSRV